MKILHLLLIGVLLVQCRVHTKAPVARATFTNPLLPSGADPWSIYHNGFYYYTHTVGDRLVIYKAASLAQLKTAERKVVFVPPQNTMYSRELWAPELHFIQNKWYLYFAADDGRNSNHRLYVLENASANPMDGTWEFKGKVSDSTDKWAIDGSVFEENRQLYMIWSGWEGDENGSQDLYIARMKNPWTIDGRRVRLSSPSFPWERFGSLHDNNNPANVYVNEGPQILQHDKDIFMVYSASGCWTDNYSLGMLTLKKGRNLMDSMSWSKSLQPVFTRSVANGVYAPGHNSFFKSPDGTEDWILYHANSAPNQGCGRLRSPRAQPFSWKQDGTPNFGEPVKTTDVLPMPSEKVRLRKQRK